MDYLVVQKLELHRALVYYPCPGRWRDGYILRMVLGWWITKIETKIGDKIVKKVDKNGPKSDKKPSKKGSKNT
jgi:hypothetical protein